MINTNDDLIMAFCLGMVAAIAFSYWYFAKRPKSPLELNKPTYLQENKSSATTTPFTLQHVVFRKNLDVSKTVLDLKETLALLEKYQQEPTPELFKVIHEQLQTHTKEGNNAVHEYLQQQEEAKVEVFEKMIEIEPLLLWEENAKGETAMHIAVDHQHFEVVDWLMEEKHFPSSEAHEHFLQHRDHTGENSLHHALEETWIHLYSVAYLHEFLHMIEKHPVGALFWKDSAGKTVYEHYFEHKEADGKKLVETLIHKGVLVHRGDHFELASDAVRDKIYAAQHADEEKVNKLLELCVTYYPQTLHHEIAEISQKLHDHPENIARRRHLIRHRPS